jgi:hypothetical protein
MRIDPPYTRDPVFEQRQRLIALLHVRVSQLTWTRQSTPQEDISRLLLETSDPVGPDTYVFTPSELRTLRDTARGLGNERLAREIERVLAC